MSRAPHPGVMADPDGGADGEGVGGEREQERDAEPASGSGLREGAGQGESAPEPRAAEATEGAPPEEDEGEAPFVEDTAGAEVTKGDEEVPLRRMPRPPGRPPSAAEPEAVLEADRVAVERTYGEWVTATVEDPGHMKENLWRTGMVIEAIVRDYEGNDQGSVVLYIITEAKSFGTFRCKCVAIEDAYFLWWMRDDAGHPDPGLWRPVFVPFDPTAGERESPPVIEVGKFRILSWGDSDVPTSLLGVRWLRPRLRLAMEAELEGYRATAGPKGVPLGDALTDFGAPGGKGKQKAKEKQAERSAAATGATSKGKARAESRAMFSGRPRGSAGEVAHSPVGGEPSGSGRRAPEAVSPGVGSAAQPRLTAALTGVRRPESGRLVDEDLQELRGTLEQEETAARRRRAAEEKERVLLVAGARGEARRSRSRPRGEARRARTREDELDEAWRIADQQREEELRSRELDLARRERRLAESLREREGGDRREDFRGLQRASPSARRQMAEAEGRWRWTRGDPGSRPHTRSRSRRKEGAASRERRAKVGAFETTRDELEVAHRRRERARGGRRGRSSSGSSAEGKRRGRSRSPSVFRGASSSTGKSTHERLIAWSEEYPGRLAARLLQRMEDRVGRDGEAAMWDKEAAPASARSYYLRVLLTKYTDMKQRNSREMFTLSVLLDHLARGRTRRAADLAAQRLKAIERSMRDKGSWEAAQYLELLPTEGDSMLEKEEELVIARERELNRRLAGPAPSGGGKSAGWGSPGGGRYQGGGKGAPFGKGEKGQGGGGDGKKGGKGKSDTRRGAGDAAQPHQ